MCKFGQDESARGELQQRDRASSRRVRMRACSCMDGRDYLAFIVSQGLLAQIVEPARLLLGESQALLEAVAF
ncbi:MAG: hypothetical protein ACPIOQ_05380 [Promethearchaeia archaeon]